METPDEKLRQQQNLFIQKQQKIIKDLRLRIVNEFSSLNHYQMKELIDAVSYRKSLIGMAKCGKLTNFIV